MIEEDKKPEEKLKEIVLVKLDSMPSNYKLSIGKEGVFDKEDLIKHVKKMDPIGKQILEMELRFMKAVTTGQLTKALTV